MFGLRRTSYSEGFEDGRNFGSMTLLRELCIGHVEMRDGKLIFDENSDYAFFDSKGELVREIDVDNIEFRFE